MMVEDVKKIALLRANAIGDFLVTLPAIYALRATYPKAEIVLLGKPWHKEFLKPGRTPVDRVIVLPVMAGMREEQGEKEDSLQIENFIAQVQQERFDLAVHFQGKGVAANKLLNRLNARVTAGISCPHAEPIQRSISYDYYQSEALRYLEVAALLGANTIILEPSMTVLQEDFYEAEAYLQEKELASYVVLHPCGTDLRRMWEPDKFAEVADALIQEGIHVVFTGSREDQAYILHIQALMRGKAYDGSGCFTLGGLAALFQKSKAVVAVDTGPLHLARYSGARTVGLYWAPNLINWGPLTRTRHKPVVSWQMQCPGCGIIPNNPFPFEPRTDTCDHAFSFIRSITPAEVIDAVTSLIQL